MKKTAPVAIDPLPEQQRFIFTRAKFAAYVGGLGSGKTWAGCLRAMLRAIRGETGLILAPTYTMLRDVTQQTLIELLTLGSWPYDHRKAEEKIVLYRPENSEMVTAGVILCRSADQPDRIRGLNLNWCYIDEAALVSEDVWKIVLGRIRYGQNPAAWVTTTPAGFNWIHRYWVEEQRKGYKLFQTSTRENRYLPAEYLADLEANYSAEFARQEIEGEFVAFEGLVYSEFSRKAHIVAPFDIPDSWQRVRSIDYGYTNPFVCLWGALDEDGRLYIYDEHYQSKTLIRDHAASIQERNHQIAWTVADHDAQDNAEMRAAGVYTTNAKKDVSRGIQAIKARLRIAGDSRPRLCIFDTCLHTLKEFGYYRWPPEQLGKPEKEDPIKEADHCMDALRYMVMQLDDQTKVIKSLYEMMREQDMSTVIS
jgi:phage terminase large subunit|tara:strand:- start:4222 stop:5487 length:1266 start_codon:yes stop_codon:yes gene_type:complete